MTLSHCDLIGKWIKVSSICGQEFYERTFLLTYYIVCRVWTGNNEVLRVSSYITAHDVNSFRSLNSEIFLNKCNCWKDFKMWFMSKLKKKSGRCTVSGIICDKVIFNESKKSNRWSNFLTFLPSLLTFLFAKHEKRLRFDKEILPAG